MLIVIDHGIMIRRLPATCLPKTLWFRVREQVHMRRVQPNEERFIGIFLTFYEVGSRSNKFIITGLHSLCVQWSCVFDLLLAHPSPARHFGRVVDIGSPGVNHTSGTEYFMKFREVLFRGIV